MRAYVRASVSQAHGLALGLDHASDWRAFGQTHTSRAMAQVSSGEFIRDVGFWLNEAFREPVEITHHGKVRLVLAVPESDPCDPEDNQV